MVLFFWEGGGNNFIYKTWAVTVTEMRKTGTAEGGLFPGKGLLWS